MDTQQVDSDRTINMLTARAALISRVASTASDETNYPTSVSYKVASWEASLEASNTLIISNAAKLPDSMDGKVEGRRMEGRGMGIDNEEDEAYYRRGSDFQKYKL